MNLADYQWEMIDQIYHLLTDDDHNKVISLHGDTGSQYKMLFTILCSATKL